jgi:hypothetical protein
MTSTKEMNPRHGFGFLAFGLFMWLLPAMTPDSFPAPSFGGLNGRAMWLEGMGIIQILFGGYLVFRYCLGPVLLRWATAAKPVETVPAFAAANAPRAGLRGAPVRADLPATLRSA